MVRRCAGGKGSRRREDLPRAIIADKLRLRYGCLGCWKKNLWEGRRAGNSCAFFIGILRFWNAERPKWRSALKIQEKPAISMDCRFLCFHYTIDELPIYRSSFDQPQNQACFHKICSPSFWTFAVLLDPILDILHGRQLLFQFLRQLARHLIGADTDRLTHVFQRVFCDQIIFALAEQQSD